MSVNQEKVWNYSLSPKNVFDDLKYHMKIAYKIVFVIFISAKYNAMAYVQKLFASLAWTIYVKFKINLKISCLNFTIKKFIW